MTNENANQSWLDRLRAAAPAELLAQIDELAGELKKFSEAEFNCLLERMKARDLRAVHEQVFAKLSGTEVLDAWDRINGKWQALNEQQYKRLESARQATLGILDLVFKVAMVGVFL